MAATWEFVAKRAPFALQHARLPLTLAQWGGALHYAVGKQEHHTPVPFGAVTENLARDEAMLNVEGPPCALQLSFRLQHGARITGTLRNASQEPLVLDSLSLTLDDVRLGVALGRYSFFKNGYQSWSMTRSFRALERQRSVILPVFNTLQDNPRNLASGKPGEFTSDLFAVLGNLDQRVYLLLGQAGGFRQFVYVRAALPVGPSGVPRLELVWDFGLQVLPPGELVELDELILLADSHANRVQDAYWDLVRLEQEHKPELPTGWCSWYYYYSKVKAADVAENVKAIQARGVDWRYFVLDDGYEAAVGDWLRMNRKFPPDLKPVADTIRAAGMTPGLWLAPFIARGNSRLFREHPEWVLRGERGRPMLAGWNPGWGLEGRFYGLDTTHPGFQAYLRQVIDTVVHAWGFPYLKLDFVYGACLAGEAHDRSLTAAQRLTLGYRLVREAAGEGALILGCGSPFSPARGMVDAMRIGPDVAPYWFDALRTNLTRDEHAVCTLFAIRNVLNRCGMHRRWWVNDPDCLMVRDTDTKLTRDERTSLANAVIITGGMFVVSDRLPRLSEETWRWLGEIERLVRECDRGRTWALDYMERAIPELVYNSQGYLAVFNFQSRSVRRQVPLDHYLEGMLPEAARFVDMWSGETCAAKDGLLDLGDLPAHASRMLRMEGA
jgi:alpha-galactosidase